MTVHQARASAQRHPDLRSLRFRQAVDRGSATLTDGRTRYQSRALPGSSATGASHCGPQCSRAHRTFAGRLIDPETGPARPEPTIAPTSSTASRMFGPSVTVAAVFGYLGGGFLI